MLRIASHDSYISSVDMLRKYEHAYYILSKPLVSDKEYDELYDAVSVWEAANPLNILAESPTQRIGSDLDGSFPEYTHHIPVLSLDKAYTIPELEQWAKRCAQTLAKPCTLVGEQKIDGLSLVLYYENGHLVRAVTRGNGLVGNDVTANVRTIHDVPIKLTRPVSGAFRGEVYIRLDDFSKINATLDEPYSNPRNFAGGTLRRISPQEVAKVPLRLFVYEGFYDQSPLLYSDLRKDLSALGFSVNPATCRLELPNDVSILTSWLEAQVGGRRKLDYEIDGLVFKIDDLQLREELGYTGHHPRWAIAFKFESPQGISVVRAIDIQVGRTGRITPVARVDAVSVGGASIQNVTLHNQAYIDAIELAVGDTVSISRRGDVIPAIEEVVEKGGASHPVWRMPELCPTCESKLIAEGAHLFCMSDSCPDKKRGRLIFFVGRDQMDIAGVGPETVDVLWSMGLVRDIPDLYTFDPSPLLDIGGFGPKKIEALKKGLTKSLEQPFHIVLASLGLPDLGPKVCELLINAGYTSMDSIIKAFTQGPETDLLAIKGLGPKTVSKLGTAFRQPAFIDLIKRLADCGLAMEENLDKDAMVLAEDQIFAGQTWCVTGSFTAFKPRELAMEEAKRRGARITGDVSSQVSHLLAGEKAGSKLEKAQKIGCRIVSETEFLALLGRTQ